MRPWKEIVGDPGLKELNKEEWAELKQRWMEEATTDLNEEERQELMTRFTEMNKSIDQKFGVEPEKPKEPKGPKFPRPDLPIGEETARKMVSQAGDPLAGAFMPGMLDSPERVYQAEFKERRPAIFSEESMKDKPYEGTPDTSALAWGGEVPANLPNPVPAIKRTVEEVVPSTAAMFHINALTTIGANMLMKGIGTALGSRAPAASRILRSMGQFDPISDVPSIATGGVTDLPIGAGRIGKALAEDFAEKGAKIGADSLAKQTPPVPEHKLPELQPEYHNVEYDAENWFKGTRETMNGLRRLSNIRPVLDDRMMRRPLGSLSGSDPLTEENIIKSMQGMGLEDINKADVEDIVAALKQARDPHEARSLWDYGKKKFVTSMMRSVENETEAGKNMAKLVRDTYMEAERRGGQWAADFFRATRDLTKLEKTNLFHVLDGSAKAMNETVQNAEVEVRTILEDVARMSQDTGITVRHPKVEKWSIRKIDKNAVEMETVSKEKSKFPYQLVDENGDVIDNFVTKAAAQTALKSYRDTPFMPISDYVPREINIDWVRQNMEKAVKYLVETGQVSRWEKNGSKRSAKEVADLAQSKINIFIKRNAERRYGHLQIARELDLPKEAYIDDIDLVLPKYFERSGMRLTEAKNYGVKDEVLTKFIEQIEEQGGDALHAQRLVDKMFHRLDYDPHGDRLANALLTYQVVTKMPLSQIGQLSQQVNALARTNMKSFAKALWYQIKNPEEAMDFAVRAGAGLNQVRLQAMQDAVGGGRLAETFLRKTGFTRMDMRSRLTASLAGRFYAEHLIDKFNKNSSSTFVRRRLAQLGIDPDGLVKVGGKYHLTDADLLKAGQKAEIDTNFRNRIIDLPDFATDRWGRLFWQFHTFAYQQTKFLNEFVVKEARHGNVLPFMYLAAGAQMTGEVVNLIRDTLQGRKHEVSVWRNWATAGTFGMFESFFGATKYNNPSFTASGRTIYNIVMAASNAFKGNIGEGFMNLMDELPTLKSWMKNIK